MIKTSELMLGNVIELGGKYVIVDSISQNRIGYRTVEGKYNGTDSNSINPIPLTEGVLKRLDITSDYIREYEDDACCIKYVHELQIRFRNANYKPDITPLLSRRYTTHDGVEVWEVDKVWIVSALNSNAPKPKWILANKDTDNTICPYFSTLEACQSYIDKVICKPIFTTEDGVDVYAGDEYWFCRKTGYNNSELSMPMINICTKTKEIDDFFIYFSTKELAQAYLNKVWSEKEYNDLISKK